MIWFVIIVAVITGVVVGMVTRSLKNALRVGFSTLIGGVLLSTIIILSGIMGG